MADLKKWEKDLMWDVIYKCIGIEEVSEGYFQDGYLEVIGSIGGDGTTERVGMNDVRNWAIEERWFGKDKKLDRLNERKQAISQKVKVVKDLFPYVPYTCMDDIDPQILKKYAEITGDIQTKEEGTVVYNAIKEEEERYWAKGKAARDVMES